MIKYLLLPLLTVFAINAHAAPVRLDVVGQLGAEVLSVHDGFENAPFSGYIEFDSSDIQTNGLTSFYEFSYWNIQINGIGVSHTLEASGETHDEGAMFFNRSSDRISIGIDEDIDNPNTGAVEDRTLQLVFQQLFDITTTTTFDDMVAADPDFGSLDRYVTNSGLYQFSTSQVPMSVPLAEVTLVPVPPALWLFVSGLLVLVYRARAVGSHYS